MTRPGAARLDLRRAMSGALSRAGAVALLFLATAGCTEEPCGGAGVICALAGTGMAAFDGDGRMATETSFYLPSAVRVGPDGLVYVMDFNNMRLRRVDADGRVRTHLGNGVHSIAVPGALAENTPLENPIDFQFSDSGALVFIAYHDPRVLRLDADGRVEVLAGSDMPGDDGDGGPALSAHFEELTGLALGLGNSGAIYVTDEKHNRVRVIENGIVRALAGNGLPGFSGDRGHATAAQLTEPTGLAVAHDGALLIADSGNHAVRRVDAKGIITTIAGAGSRGLAGDGGPATLAMLDTPLGLAVAPNGDVYLSDSGNHRVRRIDANGIITTVAGTTAGHSGDGGEASSAALHAPRGLEFSEGRIYLADQRNHTARVIFLAP
ncbi:MAG: hypothetical protein EXR75_02375 [Myxococcales bacterium]|nr:hypothetical protein [Myxococcales bacterium]